MAVEIIVASLCVPHEKENETEKHPPKTQNAFCCHRYHQVPWCECWSFIESCANPPEKMTYFALTISWTSPSPPTKSSMRQTPPCAMIPGTSGGEAAGSQVPWKTKGRRAALRNRPGRGSTFILRDCLRSRSCNLSSGKTRAPGSRAPTLQCYQARFQGFFRVGFHCCRFPELQGCRFESFEVPEF